MRPFVFGALGLKDILYLVVGLIVLAVLLRLLFAAAGFVANQVLLFDLDPPEWIDAQGKLRSLPPLRFLLVGDDDLEVSAASCLS